MGYRKAGFNVVGVDIEPQPRYPFGFIQHDAMELLQDMADYGSRILYDVYGCYVAAIHASPPCQRYSITNSIRPENKVKYPDLIAPARALLQEIGLPYVIENVPGAPLENPVTLCGSQFGLITEWQPWGKVGLRRHRLFECSGFTLPDAGAHDHSYPAVPVYGHGTPGRRSTLQGPGCAKYGREVMQIDWMQRHELAESVPPAYTLYVGSYLLTGIKAKPF
jgi:DNA (cytosine-5)-methyltransferase 1